MTPERIAAYVEELRTRGLKAISIWSYLSNALFRLFPNMDWRRLREVVNALHLHIVPSRRPDGRLLDIGVLYRAGLAHMEWADRMVPWRPLQDSIQFRNGLMLALLAATALRPRNFAALQFGIHLIRQPESYLLVVPPEEVKNRQPVECLLPDDLTEPLDRYRAYHWPRLLQETQSQHLWINQYGRVMKPTKVSQGFTKLTERLFGVPICPQLIRHSAATTIATVSPRQARIIRTILAHTGHRTAEQYYNRATMVEAGRWHATTLEALRAELTAQADDGFTERVG